MQSHKNHFKGFSTFLSNVHQWKEKLTPYTGIELFDSFEMAQKRYAFLDRVAIEQELRNIEKKE